MKLFPDSTVTGEQLQAILSAGQLQGCILGQACVIALDPDQHTANQQIARFLTQCRAAGLAHSPDALDHDWFNKQYASIIHKKKNSYPFLLSSAFACEQQLTSSQQASFLLDLASACLINIDSFADNVGEIVRAYEQITPLSTEEIDLLDAFIRLQLVLLMNRTDVDDDKQLDLLEQLSSNVIFVRNLVR